MDIRKGDGVVLHCGLRGIATTEPFAAMSHDDYEVVRVAFDVCEMPVQLISIAEVWRRGRRIDNQEQVVQMELL